MTRLSLRGLGPRDRYGSLTMFSHHVGMKSTRDDLKMVIETLRGRPSLLAAYLDAAKRVDWEAVRKPVPIGELAAVANPQPATPA